MKFDRLSKTVSILELNNTVFLINNLKKTVVDFSCVEKLIQHLAIYYSTQLTISDLVWLSDFLERNAV